MGEQQIRIRGFTASDLDELYGRDLNEIEMPSTTLEVNDSTPLSSIVAAAETELGIEPSYGQVTHLMFAREFIDVGGEQMPAIHGDSLTVVDDNGAVRWWVSFDEWNTITFSNLVDSQAAGLIGDPTDVIVIKSHQYGNGFFPIDWDAFFLVISRLADVAQVAGIVAAGLTVLRRHHKRWSDRRARPEDFQRLISAKPAWDSAALGKLLGITKSEAESILSLMGYDYDPEWLLYVRGLRDESRYLAEAIRRIFDEYESEE